MSLLKWIWEYVKKTGTLIVINFLFGITMFLVCAITNVVARSAIIYVMLAAMYVLDFFLMRSAGEQDFKMNVIGEAKRNNKPSGAPETRSTYHRSKEYRVYKGFLVGVFSLVIPAVFVIVAQLADSAGFRMGLVMAFGWLSAPVIALNAKVNLFFCFILFGVSLLLFGISYIIGGEKGRLQQYILLKKTNAISEMEKKN